MAQNMLGQANWKQRLESAARKANAKVVGWQNIREVQHGLLVATALEAFGDDPRAIFFIEIRATVKRQLFLTTNDN